MTAPDWSPKVVRRYPSSACWIAAIGFLAVFVQVLR